MMIGRGFLFLAVFFAALPATIAADDLAGGRIIETNYRIEISDDKGARHAFSVARVADRAGQARGLMHVTHLAPDTGMLFVFDPPRKVGFWMRNTLIPLDIIFIDAEGRITSIVTRRDTNSDRLTTSRAPVAAVLEINAGRAAALGLATGYLVRPVQGGV